MILHSLVIFGRDSCGLLPRFFFPEQTRDGHFDVGRVARTLNDIKSAFFQSLEVKAPVTCASGDDDPGSFISTKQV